MIYMADIEYDDFTQTSCLHVVGLPTARFVVIVWVWIVYMLLPSCSVSKRRESVMVFLSIPNGGAKSSNDSFWFRHARYSIPCLTPVGLNRIFFRHKHHMSSNQRGYGTSLQLKGPPKNECSVPGGGGLAGNSVRCLRPTNRHNKLPTFLDDFSLFIWFFFAFFVFLFHFENFLKTTIAELNSWTVLPKDR